MRAGTPPDGGLVPLKSRHCARDAARRLQIALKRRPFRTRLDPRVELLGKVVK